MKKLITTALFLGTFLFEANAQTIPTSTVTGSLKINDSLNVTNNIQTSGDMSATGNITATGEVTAQDTMRAQKDLIVDGNAKIAGALEVKGFVQAQQGFKFDNINGLKYTPAIGANGPIYEFGIQRAVLHLPIIPCPTPATPGTIMALQNFNGVYRASSLNGLVNATTEMYNTPWNGFGHIEVQGTDQDGGNNNALLINFWCGRNTGINTGPNGGKVSMGSHVDIGLPDALDATGSVDVALGVIHRSTVGVGLLVHLKNNYTNAAINTKLIVKNDNQTAFIIENEAYGAGVNARFRIKGNGQTAIGVKKPFGPHADAMLSVDGKIAAKEMVIFITNWADFVFDKNYKLMPLQQVESFINQHKHLPNVPSASDVEANNGIDIGKTQTTLLQKIEELTLYLIEQNKRLENLEKENVEMKHLLNTK